MRTPHSTQFVRLSRIRTSSALCSPKADLVEGNVCTPCQDGALWPAVSLRLHVCEPKKLAPMSLWPVWSFLCGIVREPSGMYASSTVRTAIDAQGQPAQGQQVQISDEDLPF